MEAKLAFIRKDAQGTIDGQFSDRQLRNTADRHARQVTWLIDRFLLPPPEQKRIFLVRSNDMTIKDDKGISASISALHPEENSRQNDTQRLKEVLDQVWLIRKIAAADYADHHEQMLVIASIADEILGIVQIKPTNPPGCCF